MSRALTAAALALTLCAGTLWTAHVRAAQQQTYNLTLSTVETSTDATGRLVVAGAVAGDLRGTLTLAVTRDANGAITGGEWAFNNSYIELLPVAPTAVASSDPDGGERLVQNGLVKGSVASGTATLDANGRLATLSDVVLVVNGGTLTYAGTTSGTGLLGGSSLADRAASTGALSLIF